MEFLRTSSHALLISPFPSCWIHSPCFPNLLPGKGYHVLNFPTVLFSSLLSMRACHHTDACHGAQHQRDCTLAPTSIEFQGHPESPGLWRISEKKSGVWVVQVCKEKFRLKSAVLKCVPLETVQGGWMLTHLYLASFISDSVTFLAIGPSLFCGQKALRYSWGWEFDLSPWQHTVKFMFDMC